MNALPSVMSRRPETGIVAVSWAEEAPGAAWVFPGRVSRGRPEFRVRREFWAGRASGAGSVSAASAPRGLSVTVVIRGIPFVAAPGIGRARRSAGWLKVNASGDWGNEHPGEIQKQHRRQESYGTPCARIRSCPADRGRM